MFYLFIFYCEKVEEEEMLANTTLALLPAVSEAVAYVTSNTKPYFLGHALFCHA